MFKKKNLFAAMALSLSLLLPSISASASGLPVDTLLNHPDFGDISYCPDNRFYDATNIHGTLWNYGYECNTLNTNGIDAVVTEVLANFSPASYKTSWFSMWTQGADLSQKNISDLYNAGWDILGVTYYDYWIETKFSPIEADYYAPRFSVLDDENIRLLLTENGYAVSEKPVGILQFSGIDMPCRSCVFYCPDFGFLKGKTIYTYRFYPEKNRFVKDTVVETRYNSYDPKFLDMYYGTAAADINGIFVYSTSALPENLVVTKEELDSIQDLPEQEEKQPEEEKWDTSNVQPVEPPSKDEQSNNSLCTQEKPDIETVIEQPKEAATANKEIPEEKAEATPDESATTQKASVGFFAKLKAFLEKLLAFFSW